ncbi:CoA ester lyase [Sphingorhabdus soli]|uniref:CoA ester lyase n=1 Tax=Flavisphingopyxis soli TaxID=2601267 RepID=A0A5C6U842_9SPHN|nr:CoA ester lyase [Sphingorhabdus soli]TXC69193.1 CoA ester lyase [Sphingorhabdus soli]
MASTRRPEPRSWLFIPGDSAKKLGKADDCGADAVIIDLEDSVAAAARPAARALTADFLTQRPSGVRASQLWVRINPLDGDDWKVDLAAVVGARPDGYMLPKCAGPADVATLAEALGDTPGAILPVATETPAAVFALGDYAGDADPRLAGLTWGAEDLGAAIGASGNRWPDGRFHETFRMVRSLTLLAAHAAGVQAIDTLYADFRDSDGLRADSERSAIEGFTGRLAIHPAQVAVINAAYLPSPASIDAARRIVEAFAAQPDAGTIGLDGKMIDRPHLVQAERLIARAEAFAGR